MARNTPLLDDEAPTERRAALGVDIALPPGAARNGRAFGTIGRTRRAADANGMERRAHLQAVAAAEGDALSKPEAPRSGRLPSRVALFGLSLRTPMLILVLLDFAGLSLIATAVAAAAATLGLMSTTAGTANPVIVALLLMAAAVATGLYNADVQYRERNLGGRCVVAFALLAPTAMLLLDALTLPELRYPLPLLLATAGLATVFTLTIRRSLRALLSPRLFRRRILVLGAGREAARIDQRMRRESDRLGFEIVAYVTQGSDAPVEAPAAIALESMTLRDYCARQQIEEVVVALDDRRGGSAAPMPLDELLDCKMAGIEVVELVDFIEREAGRIDVETLRPSSLLYAPAFSRPIHRAVKRIVDLVIASVLLLVTSPVMLLTAVAIKIEDGLRAPVLYRQTRVGALGAPYRMLKFRSMRLACESDTGPCWAQHNDPRVTRVGRWIRSTHIDELPQLLNVLRGQMALVGPRPERPVFVQRFSQEIPFYSERQRVKPGLTGWAQLQYPYGCSDDDARYKLEYDLYYVKNWTPLMDLFILLRTVEMVLINRGTH